MDMTFGEMLFSPGQHPPHVTCPKQISPFVPDSPSPRAPLILPISVISPTIPTVAQALQLKFILNLLFPSSFHQKPT